MDNPFNPGSGSTPPFLAGRDKELTLFERTLESIRKGKNENIVLTGLRGTGKTVLLNEFDKICLEKKFFPIKRLQFSPKHNNPAEFYLALKYDISTAVSNLSSAKKIGQKLYTMGNVLKPKSVGVPGTFYYEPAYESNTIPFENHIEDYLSNNWQVFKKNGFNGVIFLFDEFHLISDNIKEKFYVLTDFIGAINELQKKGFPYYLVLTGLPKISLNIKKARSYSERMFKTVVLNNLSRDEAILAVSQPLKNSPHSFERNLINMIADDTGQYPYFIQFYCKEIIDRIHRKIIRIKDYESIKSNIIQQLEVDFFDPRIDSLTNMEEKVLISMAKITNENIGFNEIVAKSKIKKASLSKYIDRLEKKGLIYRHKHGLYRYSLPMLRSYIARKHQRNSE